MKDFLNKKYRLLPILSLVLTVAAAVFLILALKSNFDYTLGYFDFASPAFVALAVSLSLGVILTAAAAVTSKDYSLMKRPADNIATVFGGTFASVICLFNIFEKLGGFASAGVPLKELGTPAVLNLLTAVLQIALPLFCLLALGKKTRVSRARAAVGSIGVLSFVSHLFATYFDFTLPINSPMRYLNIIATSCCALYLLGESRLSFPKEANRPPYRISLVSSVLCSSLSLGLSAAFIIASCFITGAESTDPTPPILFSALYAALSVSALGRLVSLKNCGRYSPKPKEAEGEKQPQ